MTPELREGDIYRWRWADPKLDANNHGSGSYHCKSRIAVVEGGRLHDTYWSSGGSDRWLDPEKVTLTFWANTADLAEISSYNVVYYRREDVVDLRHANNSRGPVYLRNGAKRNANTMLEVIVDRLEKAHRDLEWAKRHIEQLMLDSEKVRAGKLDEVYL